VKNAKNIWKFDDCATVPHTTDYEGLRDDGKLHLPKMHSPESATAKITATISRSCARLAKPQLRR
jgi:hypothetical protein